MTARDPSIGVLAVAIMGLAAAVPAHAISGGEVVAQVVAAGANARATPEYVAVARAVGASTVALVLLDEQGRPEGLCSGTVVHERVVLTAGHCAVASGGSRRLSVVFEDSRGGITRRESLDVAVHPAFLDLVQGSTFRRKRGDLAQKLRRDEAFFSADLALVLLHRPIPESHRVVTVVAPGYRDRAGAAKVIAGYGAPGGFSSDGSPTLRFAEVVGGSLRAGRGEVTDADELVLESKFRNGARVTTCKGDSGGPVFLREGNAASLRLAGVTSAGDEHCREVAVAANIDGQRLELRRMFRILMKGEQGSEANPF